MNRITISESNLCIKKPEWLVVVVKETGKNSVVPLYQDHIGCWHCGNFLGQLCKDGQIQMFVLTMVDRYEDALIAIESTLKEARQTLRVFLDEINGNPF